ncbi:MAG TPA: thiolase family protein [Elusimicrobiota bacterium]|nr:thiolase family protein [Elusimicrobiota bacterium]
MRPSSTKVVLCGGVRTPIGHLAKSLAGFLPEDLMEIVIRGILQKSSLYPHAVDGVLVGWVGQGSHAPNIARVALLKAGLPEKAHAFTIQANCVSSLESVASAYRHIMMSEGDLYLAGGTESMSTFPYAIRGPRSHKSLRSLDAVKTNWAELLNTPDVCLTDTTEEGLTDPVKKISMAATAEICAQMYSISREEQDAYAAETFRRALAAEKNGFYDTHTVPVKKDGRTVLDRDEYPFLREGLVEKPQMFAKAPALFESGGFTMKDFYANFGEHILGKTFEPGKSQGTVTLFNACARSDGAAGLVVASEERAKQLGLEILAEIKSWGFWGNNPAHMGVSPVFSSAVALERAGLKFADLDHVELHEAFAATSLSIFKVGKEKHGQDWRKLWDSGRLNPNGGSIPLGHPLAATGARLLLNLLYAMKQDPGARFGLVAACAAGGLGGAMVVEKYR